MTNLEVNGMRVDDIPKCFAAIGCSCYYKDCLIVEPPESLTSLYNDISMFGAAGIATLKNREELLAAYVDVNHVLHENNDAPYLLTDKNYKVRMESIFNDHEDYVYKLIFYKDCNGEIYVTPSHSREILEHCPWNNVNPLTKEEMDVVKERIFRRLKIFAWTNFTQDYKLGYGLVLGTGFDRFERFFTIPCGTDFDYEVDTFYPLSYESTSVSVGIIKALAQEKCYLATNFHQGTPINIDAFPVPTTNPFQTYVDNYLKEHNVNSGL